MKTVENFDYYHPAAGDIVVHSMEGEFVGFEPRLPKNPTVEQRAERATKILTGIERMVGQLDVLSRRVLVGPVADDLPKDLSSVTQSSVEHDPIH